LEIAKMTMMMKAYNSNINALYYDRLGKRGLEQPLQVRGEPLNIKAPRHVGRAVLAYNFGIFGDNMPVLWVKHL
jgi:hypothetical protein